MVNNEVLVENIVNSTHSELNQDNSNSSRLNSQIQSNLNLSKRMNEFSTTGLRRGKRLKSAPLDWLGIIGPTMHLPKP